MSWRNIISAPPPCFYPPARSLLLTEHWDCRTLVFLGISIGADLSPQPDLASWGDVSGRQHLIRCREHCTDFLLGRAYLPSCLPNLLPVVVFISASPRCSHWEATSPSLQQRLAPTEQLCLRCQQTHIYPPAKTDMATTVSGGIPAVLELARQRLVFPSMPSARCMRS